MERYAELPPLPTRIRRLDELACDLWWSWHSERADVFRRLDYPLWRPTAHNPVRMLRLMPRERLDAAAEDPAFLALLRQRHRRPRRGAHRARHVVGGALRPAVQRGAHRLLLRRVRAAPVAADLRRRPRRARRRSLQGSQRPRRAARRRRLHVSAGLLPPARVGRRLAGGSLRAAQLGRRADRAGAARPTASRASSPVPLGDRTVLVAVWRVRARPRAAATCSTPISRRTRRGIASCRRASTAATARRASSRRSSSASAACARCGRWASQPRSGT